MLLIRDAGPADRDLLVGWYLAMFDDLARASHDPWFAGAVLSRPAAAEAVDSMLAAGDLLLIAERAADPSGFLAGRVERPYAREATVSEIGHIALVRVVPEARRTGIARALVAEAEDRFRARGLEWVQLSWNPANEAAGASWAAGGFVPFRMFGRKRL